MKQSAFHEELRHPETIKVLLEILKENGIYPSEQHIESDPSEPMLTEDKSAELAKYISELAEKDKIISELNVICEKLRNQLNTEEASLSSAKEQLRTEINEHNDTRNKLNSESTAHNETKTLLDREIEKCRQAEEHLGKKEKELDKLAKKITASENELKVVRDKLGALEFSFGEPIEIFKKYKALPAEIQERLSNIICSGSIIGFISSCSRIDTLDSLWEYIKTIIQKDDSSAEEIATLKCVFDYFFDLYNTSSPRPIYRRCLVETGERLDDEMHIRGKGSSVSGRINEVLLAGYESINTGKIIKKSIVIAR